MNSLTAIKAARVETVPASFEEKLVWLCNFGKPGVWRGDRGWNVGIKMNTNTTGSTFEVNSEYTHLTPGAALDQCIERMLIALATITGATP